MSFKLVDTIRGKVLQEFETKEQAEKALSHQLIGAPLEIQSPPKAKKASKKVATDGE